ncbi:MAG: VCBS repeat-containing protein, partial [Gemmatimonadota bacterium]|nr:VCBS repeat-containing protein [Gemmatimonadota bacterium]
SDGVLLLYPTDGAGTFLQSKQVGNGWNVMTSIFSPGDFNRSGAPDVIGRRSDGILLLYPGDGDGGWGRPVRIGHGWGSMAWIG